jgi:hypothetical protein
VHGSGAVFMLVRIAASDRHFETAIPYNTGSSQGTGDV